MQSLHLPALLSIALLFSCAARGQHIVEIRPTISGTAGELRFFETDGVAAGTATNYVAFRAPASIASNVTWTLPSADGTAGQALVTDGAGALSWGAGGGAAGYSYIKDYTVSLTQRDTLHFVTQAFNCYDDSSAGDGDGLETECALDTSPLDSAVVVGTGRTLTTTAPLTIAGTTSADLSADRTLACPTCVTTDTVQTITGAKTFSVQDVALNGVALRTQSSGGVLRHLIKENGTNITTVYNASSVAELTIDSQLDRFTVAMDTYSQNIVPNAGSTYSVGGASLRYAQGYFDTLNVYTELLPDVDGGANLGSAAKQFDAHLEDVTMYGGILPSFRGGSNIGLPGSEFGGVFSNSYTVGRASLANALMTFYRDTGSGGAVLRGATYSSATAIEADALAISASGSFYMRVYSGADVNCSGVTDGWIGYRLDTDEIQICDGGAMVAK